MIHWVKNFLTYSIIYVSEVDECEPSGPAGLVVVHHLDVIDGAVTAEDLAQVALLGVDREAEDAHTAWLMRVLLLHK